LELAAKPHFLGIGTDPSGRRFRRHGRSTRNCSPSVQSNDCDLAGASAGRAAVPGSGTTSRAATCSPARGVTVARDSRSRSGVPWATLFARPVPCRRGGASRPGTSAPAGFPTRWRVPTACRPRARHTPCCLAAIVALPRNRRGPGHDTSSGRGVHARRAGLDHGRAGCARLGDHAPTSRTTVRRRGMLAPDTGGINALTGTFSRTRNGARDSCASPFCPGTFISTEARLFVLPRHPASSPPSVPLRGRGHLRRAAPACASGVVALPLWPEQRFPSPALDGTWRSICLGRCHPAPRFDRQGTFGPSCTCLEVRERLFREFPHPRLAWRRPSNGVILHPEPGRDAPVNSSDSRVGSPVDPRQTIHGIPDTPPGRVPELTDPGPGAGPAVMAGERAPP